MEMKCSTCKYKDTATIVNYGELSSVGAEIKIKSCYAEPQDESDDCGNYVMEKKELLKRLKEECTSGDEEVDHANADELLLEYIDDEEITKAFNEIDKWYT